MAQAAGAGGANGGFPRKDRFELAPAFPADLLEQDLPAGFDMGGVNHWHDCLEISWVESGAGRYWLEAGEAREMGPGDIIVINNLEPHRLEVGPVPMRLSGLIFDPELVWAGCGASLDRDYLEPFFSRGDDLPAWVAAGEPGAAALTAELAAAATEFRERRPAWRLAVKARLLVVLALLLRRMEPAALPVPAAARLSRRQRLERLEPVFAFLEDQYRRPVALEEAAARCNLSPSYFSSQFKELCGLGFAEWLNRYRVNRAIELLESTDWTVARIAQECGFGQAAALNESFRRHAGRTPRDYRAGR